MKVFVNQKRVNVRECTVKMAPHDKLVSATRGRNRKKRRDGEKRERELSEVNSMAVSGGYIYLHILIIL